ncbi:MAG: winged helix-turn-helix domain-containing protein [Nanoarchaeota archaeon]|nr:winged helix-turn-helix domain-containing protein [Nanoarchaeota archaeon]
MRSGKDNEMRFVLSILKSPESKYNANNLAKHIGISAMGALKIARKLEKEGVIKLRKVGNANIYSINFDSEYVLQYIKYLLKKESEQASAYVKRWIRELDKIKKAEAMILFGSVLRKEREARDVDVLIIVHKNNFDAIKEDISKINIMNDKKVHPMYQTKKDLQKHINEENKVVLNALKGIVVSGEDIVLSVLKQ